MSESVRASHVRSERVGTRRDVEEEPRGEQHCAVGLVSGNGVQGDAIARPRLQVTSGEYEADSAVGGAHVERLRVTTERREGSVAQRGPIVVPGHQSRHWGAREDVARQRHRRIRHHVRPVTAAVLSAGTAQPAGVLKRVPQVAGRARDVHALECSARVEAGVVEAAVRSRFPALVHIVARVAVLF